MSEEIKGKPVQPLPPDFDPTAELWDRLTEDIAETGAPCLETVENLVHQACYTDPNPGKKKDSSKDKEEK